MYTEILGVKGDWVEVVDDCRATVAKPELGHEPSEAFKKAIMLSEHEPIRGIEVRFRWRSIPYWVAMHFKTHIWRCRTNSQRNDRQTKYDRTKAPQGAPVDLVGSMNGQHHIDTARKRLCRMAAPETRHYMEDYKRVLREVEPQISDVMVPNCIYRCGCPESAGCGWYQAMVAKHPKLASTNIQQRYDAYNEMFYGGVTNDD